MRRNFPKAWFSADWGVGALFDQHTPAHGCPVRMAQTIKRSYSASHASSAHVWRKNSAAAVSLPGRASWAKVSPKRNR